MIGASDRAGSVGATAYRNLLDGGFAGPVYAVNPGHATIAGRRAYRDVSSLPEAPDLAVIATPPAAVPGVVRELAARGTRAAVILTAGMSSARDDAGRSLTRAALDAARGSLLRILGPNCVGMLVPGLGLNASFAHTAALPGQLAFVSQSGGLTTAVLDWAKSRGIGFSHFISLGEAADVDFGDIIDYLASDPGTRAILLYVEAIRGARKFMSAARAASRNKPVIVVKSGRAPEGIRAAMTHTGALAGSDDVYDAAIRRAGMLRVDTVADLFGAVETLARAPAMRDGGLVIMTNGGGAGVMAADALGLKGDRLATLAPETLARLDAALPATWSHGNPVDIIGDAPVARYVETFEALLAEPDAAAVLFIQIPSAIVPSADIARACVPVASGKRVLACWLGGDAQEGARRVFGEAGIPCYDTPEEAVGAFHHATEYRRNREILMETPPSVPAGFVPDRATAQSIVREALAQGRAMLGEPEAKALMAAYGIPAAATRVASDAEHAARLAGEIGFPVALKILSPQVTHKSDVDGVALNLATVAEVRGAAERMARQLRVLAPGAQLTGFTVQEMVRRPNARETLVGVAMDPVFGPVILFGQGGVDVEIVRDHAIGLPPLNMALARELVSRTRVARLLAAFRNRPSADREALHLALTRVSQLVVDVPELQELDINPLLVDNEGVIALDARIRVAPAQGSGTDRLAIKPYPVELEERVNLAGREILLRPIRPEDEPAHARFLASVAPADLHLRFFHAVRSFSHSELARFTQIDYDREMAIIATSGGVGAAETLGVVRAISDPDGTTAEFAILVRSDIAGRGLGRLLMEKIIGYCRSRGISRITGDVLASNARMLSFARCCGFSVESYAIGVCRVTRDLTGEGRA
jgi:acetyltransferase